MWSTTGETHERVSLCLFIALNDCRRRYISLNSTQWLWFDPREGFPRNSMLKRDFSLHIFAHFLYQRRHQLKICLSVLAKRFLLLQMIGTFPNYIREIPKFHVNMSDD